MTFRSEKALSMGSLKSVTAFTEFQTHPLPPLLPPIYSAYTVYTYIYLRFRRLFREFARLSPSSKPPLYSLPRMDDTMCIQGPLSEILNFLLFFLSDFSFSSREREFLKLRTILQQRGLFDVWKSTGVTQQDTASANVGLPRRNPGFPPSKSMRNGYSFYIIARCCMKNLLRIFKALMLYYSH